MSDIAKRLREGVDPNEIAAAEYIMDMAAAEIERLLADKDVRRSQARNTSYEASIRELEAEKADLVAALRNIVAGNAGECGCAETARAAIDRAEGHDV